MKFATFLNRFFAMIFDDIFVSLIFYFFAFLYEFYNSNNYALAFGSLGTKIEYSIIANLILFIYFIYFTATTGQTIGKKICKIKVVKIDGSDVGFISSMIRYLPLIIRFSLVLIFYGLIIKALSILILIDYLWIFFDNKKQCLHDKLAGTYVILESSIIKNK